MDVISDASILVFFKSFILLAKLKSVSVGSFVESKYVG